MLTAPTSFADHRSTDRSPVLSLSAASQLPRKPLLLELRALRSSLAICPGALAVPRRVGKMFDPPVLDNSSVALSMRFGLTCPQASRLAIPPQGLAENPAWTVARSLLTQLLFMATQP